MVKKLIALFLSFILFFLIGTASAQVKKYQFDKITPADFTNAGLIDTTAAAIVIADVATSRYECSGGLNLIFNRKLRMKILKPEGAYYATIIIPLHKIGRSKELAGSFQGFTYNLENGVVVTTKLQKDDIFFKEENPVINSQRIAIPAVRANSIIDLEYEIRSDFLFNPQPWAFQWEIPVNMSEYTVTIPDVFHFKKISHGYIPFAVYETSTGLFTKSTGCNFRTQPQTETFHWIAENVPALKPEPFLTTIKDYQSGVEFELESFHLDGYNESFSDTWVTVNEKLLENEDFGKAIKKGNFISGQLATITANTNTELDKAIAIFNHVRDRMKWNGVNWIYTFSPPRKIYDDRVGTSGEINLLLLAILKEAGFQADPVVLSTRSNGMILEAYPMVSKLDYVIAQLTIGDNKYLLDATSKYLPFNTLPERCLNGQGRIVSKENAGWVELLNSQMKNEYTLADFTLAEDGSLKGTCAISYAGLSANDRRELYNNKGQKEFIKDFGSKHDTWSIPDFKAENLDSLNKPFIETYTIEATDGAQVAGDKIYLNVMAGLGQKLNPFKLEKRTYPVDFSCPTKEMKVVKIALPKGWVVEEMPQPELFSLPEKAALFKLQVVKGDGFIQVSSNLLITKSLYLPEEYEQLKEFFRLITTKHAMQVVLKKA